MTSKDKSGATAGRQDKGLGADSVDITACGEFVWSKARCTGAGFCAEACEAGAITIQKDNSPSKKTAYSCAAACPAGVDVARYLRFIAAGKFPEAVAVIRERIPFPGSCGFVCQAPCEKVCQRAQLDENILIRELKRAAFEHDDGRWKKAVKPAPPTGKSAAIIGSGPAGLTTAYYLARKGHSVTVFEAMKKPGGKMMYSIRDWHLPKDVLLNEIRDIEEAGVTIKTESRIESADSLFDEGFDAVLLSAGLHRHAKLPPISVKASLTGDSFLESENKEAIIKPGSRVVILGGGQTAFACAMEAQRLGALEVHLVSIEYRSEGESDVLASEYTVRDGASIHAWRMFPRVIREDNDITGVEYYKIRAFGFDSEGELHIDTVDGSGRFIAAEVVLDAMGESEDLHQNQPGLFVAGDAVSELRSVIEAIAAGRWVASGIDKYLGGDGNIAEKLAPEEASLKPVTEPSTAKRPEIEVNIMPGGYSQVNLSIPAETAITEAGRCLSCDLGYPVSKFSVNTALCTYCGKCLDSCYWSALTAGSGYPNI